MIPILCLFDIDGTLIKGTSKNGRSPSLAHAFDKIYGIADFSLEKYPQSDGSTDLNIVLDVGTKNNLAEKDILPKFKDFIEVTVEYLNTYPDYPNFILPCAKTLVGVLSKKKVICGVLTGNAAKKGWWKLKATGFDRFIKFGAFGDVSIKRSDLFPIALKEAENFSGLKFTPENVYIIGDTCHDVEVAKVHGVKSIAVATGRMTETELKKCGADYILPDFTKTKKFLEIIGVK